MAKCRQKLAELGVTASMRALYIERDDEAFGNLERYLDSATPDTVSAKCFHGDFVSPRANPHLERTRCIHVFLHRPKGLEVDWN